MLCIVPLKREDVYRKRAIRIAEICLIVTVVIVDIMSLKLIFAGVNRGITVNENYLGNINSCAAVIAANCFFINKNKIPRIAYGIAFLEALLFVLLSTSRASLLAIAVYLFLVFCLNLKKNYARKKELVLSVILIMVIVLLASLKIIAEFIIANNMRFSSFLIKALTGRYTIWFKVFPQYIRDSWLFGNGVSTMSYVNSSKLIYAGSLVSGVRNDIFHNFILDIIYHGGLVGVIILGIGSYHLIRFIKRRVDFRKDSTRLYLAALFSFLVTYLFDMLFIWDYSIAFFLMLCSILINRKERHEKA